VSLGQKILSQLQTQDWAMVEAVLPSSFLKDFKGHLVLKKEEGCFRASRIGRGTGLQQNAEVRSDSIYWLEKNQCDLENQMIDFLESLLTTARQEWFLPVQSLEAHAACYPQGSFYQKHLDQHGDSQARLLSLVLYLNEGWAEKDRGCLRLYTQEGHKDIFPELGTLVVFKSNKVLHEVLPTERERWSIAAWLRSGAQPLS